MRRKLAFAAFLAESVVEHGFRSRHGGTPSPQPNSGLPEFGHLMTWPKSETSDFGGGEGWVRGFGPIDSL